MSLLPFGLVVLFGFAITFAFIVWGRSLSGLYGAPRWLRWIGYAPGTGWLVLISLSVRAFMRGIAVPSGDLDPAAKARILAETISEGMHLFALSWAFFVVFVVPMLFFTWRYRWSKKLPKAEGKPPYR